MADQPFTPENAPVLLKARGRRIPQWKQEPNGLVGEIQQGPVRSAEAEEQIALIPMGCARLRITSFPTIGDETLAARFTGKIRPQNMAVQVDVDFIAHMVAIRRGRAVAYIVVGAIGGATPGQEVEDIIRVLDARMVEALE